MRMEIQHTKTHGFSKSNSNRGVYSNKHSQQQKRKTSNKQPNFIPKESEEKKLKDCVGKKVAKIKAIINAIVTMKTIEKIKVKAGF